MSINEKIYEFLNSKDIAEYLKEINYKFSTAEAAFIVYKSFEHTLDEKIEAWQSIIKEMPDCSMARRMNMIQIDSFHTFLRQYIDLQKDMLNYFYGNTGAVYSFKVCYKDDPPCEYSRPFSTYEKCFDALTAELEYMQEYEKDNIFIKKQEIDCKNDYTGQCTATYNSNLEMMSIRQNALPEQKSDICEAFLGMWFQIPTPFKRGDLLIEKNSRYSAPFVLDEIIYECHSSDPEITERHKKLVKHLTENGDTTDMSYTAYYSGENGIYMDHGNDYLALEYYREK